MSETFISVDIEASGPVPGRYSMLSLGACNVSRPENSFYIELQPIGTEYVPEALAVSKFDLDTLGQTGIAPREAMSAFDRWVRGFERPIFVGFNAAFDWAFVNHYFLTYGPGQNPFGFAPLDIKAFAMGRLHITWEGTRSSKLLKLLNVEPNSESHDALGDARFQAQLFSKLL